MPNAGFEEKREIVGDIASPTQWTVTGAGQVVSSPTYNGRHALQTNDGSDTASVTVLSRDIPVSAGETIRASVWAQVQSGRAGALYLEFRRADGLAAASYVAKSFTRAQDGWQEVVVKHTGPADAVFCTLRIYSAEAEAGVTVWDEVTLRSS